MTGALAALDLVAPTSGAYAAARRRRAELLTAGGPGLDGLAAAAASIDNIAIDSRDRLTLQAQILRAAVAEVERTGDRPTVRVGPSPATGAELRAAAEQTYRDLASLTSDPAERIRLVDAANAIRPRTLV